MQIYKENRIVRKKVNTLNKLVKTLYFETFFVVSQHLHQSENGKGDEEELDGVADGCHHPTAGQIHLAFDPSPPLAVTYSDSFILRIKSTGRGLGSSLRERPRPMDFGVRWARASSDAQRGLEILASENYCTWHEFQD